MASPVVLVVVSMPKSAARDERGRGALGGRTVGGGGSGPPAVAGGSPRGVGPDVGLGVGLGRAGLDRTGVAGRHGASLGVR